MELDRGTQRLFCYSNFFFFLKGSHKSETLSGLSQVSALLVWSVPYSQSSGLQFLVQSKAVENLYLIF